MCGCLGNKSSVSSGNYSKNKTTTTIKSKEKVCMDLYSELKNLDFKVVQILEKNNDSLLKQANKQLRMWIRNLDKTCPPEYERQVLTQFIEDEFTKYNT